MRNSAGKLSDRVHLLRMDQPAFQKPLLGYIGERARKLRRFAGWVGNDHSLVMEVLVAAICNLPAIFDRQSASFAAGFNGGQYAIAIVRVQPTFPKLRIL